MIKINWLETLKLWIFCFFNIPLIFYLRPRVIELTEDQCIIEIKLNRRSKNHLRSMYFGSLCTGADLAPGLIVFKVINNQKRKVSFLFKDFTADFLKRCDGNVRFSCFDGKRIQTAIEQGALTKERQNITVAVTATVPSSSSSECYARFSLTLSIKLKNT